MRRTRFILALVTTVFAVTASIGLAGPAHAHFCSIPAQIEVGEDVMVNIGVAAEDKPVRGVDIEVPAGFALKEPVGFMGYEPTRRGKWVHFEGAEIEPYGCHYFAFSGHAVRKGRLVARIVTTAADGTRTRYDSLKPAALYPPMLIYAGVDPSDIDAGGSGSSRWVLGGVVVVVTAAALVVLRRIKASGA